MDLRCLKTFQIVVKTGSMQKTAEELQYVHSTITMQIQKLESDLDISLFHREGKKMVLTEAGRFLYEKSAPILASLDDLKQSITDFKKGSAGHIRIGVIEPAATYLMPEILSTYCNARPHLHLKLKIGETMDLIHHVDQGELDVAICSSPPIRDSLYFEPLFNEIFSLLLSEQHPLSSKEIISPIDLIKENILLTEQNSAYRTMIERVLMEEGINLTSGMEISSLEVIKRMVHHNLGIAIMPNCSLIKIPRGTVIRQVNNIDLRLSIGMVTRSRTTSSQSLENLMQELRDRFPNKTLSFQQQS